MWNDILVVAPSLEWWQVALQCTLTLLMVAVAVPLFAFYAMSVEPMINVWFAIARLGERGIIGQIIGALAAAVVVNVMVVALMIAAACAVLGAFDRRT